MPYLKDEWEAMVYRNKYLRDALERCRDVIREELRSRKTKKPELLLAVQDASRAIETDEKLKEMSWDLTPSSP